MNYNPDGAAVSQKKVEDFVRSEPTLVINPYGKGDVTAQIIPKSDNPERVGTALYFPIGLKYPPGWTEFADKTGSYGSTEGDKSAIGIDEQNGSTIGANQLAIAETFWREATVRIVTPNPNAPVDTTIAMEVVANYFGKIWGQKVAGNPLAEVQRSMKRTTNVHTSNEPVQLPEVTQAAYDAGPGRDGKIFG